MLSGFAQEICRKGVGAVALADAGQDPLLGEPADLLAQHLLFLP